MPTIRYALAWGGSQSGRFLRHFLYQGFNADAQGRRVFDGVIDERGGAGRGSFNHRFAQASRDALEHYNILFPVDMFPFTDGLETDPLTGETDGLLARADRSGTAPKVFHILSGSEYWNRAGSLLHTDVTGTRDVAVPANVRLYFMSSAPHIIGPRAARLAPVRHTGREGRAQSARSPSGGAQPVPRHGSLGHRRYRPAGEPVSADCRWHAGASATRWMARDTRISRSATAADQVSAGLRPQLVARHRRQRAAEDRRAVCGAGAGRGCRRQRSRGGSSAGTRRPAGTFFGWNYRDASVGSPEHLAGEIGSYIPFARTRAERQRSGDPRLSIEERYPNKGDYMARIEKAAKDLVTQGYLLARDVPDVVARASVLWDWAMSASPR